MIILATNNKGKVEELKGKIGKEVFSLADLNIDVEIVEDGQSLYENALIKAKTIASMFPNDIVIADDTGLFVDELGGKPGIYSARYAGVGCSSEDNIDKLLKELSGVINRNAHFETCIVVYVQGLFYDFIGKLEGTILNERDGNGGFGYDSVFYATEVNNSLANVTKEEKNKYSHRGRAISKLINANILDI